MNCCTDQVGMKQFQSDYRLFTYGFTLYHGYFYIVWLFFTWWNKREEDPIGKKLGRALGNGDLLRCFPQSYAWFEAGGVSYHARCLVQLAGSQDETTKPFRFFNYLAEHEVFLPTVKALWDISLGCIIPGLPLLVFIGNWRCSIQACVNDIA